MRSGKGLPPVRLCGIDILPMRHGLEGAPSAEFCVGAPKTIPQGVVFWDDVNTRQSMA
jgi:hypothetical protein